MGVSGFRVNASPDTVAAGASLTVTWTAPGASNTNPAAVYNVSGSSGTFAMPAPHTAGQYRFRYLLGGSGWITAAVGPVITVQ